MPESSPLVDSLSRLVADAERCASEAASRLSNAEVSLHTAVHLVDAALAAPELAGDTRHHLSRARDALFASLRAVIGKQSTEAHAAPVVGKPRSGRTTASEAIEPLNLVGVAALLVGDDGGFDPQLLDDMREAGASVDHVTDLAIATERVREADLTAVFLDTLASALRDDPAVVNAHIRALCEAANDNTLLVAFCDTPPTADPQMRELSSLSRLSWWSFPPSIDVVVRKLSHRHADLRRQTPTGMVTVGERRRLTKTTTAEPTRGVSPPPDAIAAAERAMNVPPTPLPAEVSTSRSSAAASTPSGAAARPLRKAARDVGTSTSTPRRASASASASAPPHRPNAFESAVPTPAPEAVAAEFSRRTPTGSAPATASTSSTAAQPGGRASGYSRTPTPATVMVDTMSDLFDFETAIGKTGGDHGFFRSIVELFLLNEKDLWTRIGSAVDANDSVALHQAVQAFASALDNLAAHRALKLTTELERIARDDALQSAGSVLSDLDRERKLLKHALETFLSKAPA